MSNWKKKRKKEEDLLPQSQVYFYTEAAPGVQQTQCMNMELIQWYHQQIGKKLNLLQLSFAAEGHQGSLVTKKKKVI